MLIIRLKLRGSVSVWLALFFAGAWLVATSAAIDFDMAIERQPDQKGDRVKVTMSGKFLSYKEY